MFEKFYAKIVAHAVTEAPYESLGIIYAGEYKKLKNVSEEPETTFLMSSKDMSKYMLSDKLEAIVHSHPGRWVLDEEDGKEYPEVRDGPSKIDMQQQLETNVPWIIAYEDVRNGTWKVFEWGAHTLDLPILERPFVHGVEDCYELIRKYQWQKHQDLLPSFPRDDFWWDLGEDLYLDNFEKAGYKRFVPGSPADLEPGDVFLHRIASKVYNHGGVYPGHGVLWHHAPHKLSNSVPLGPMFRRVDIWLRKEK